MRKPEVSERIPNPFSQDALWSGVAASRGSLGLRRYVPFSLQCQFTSKDTRFS